MTPLGGNAYYVAVADFALCAGLLITVLDFNIYLKKSRRVNQPPLNPTDPETERSSEHEGASNPLLLWRAGSQQVP